MNRLVKLFMKNTIAASVIFASSYIQAQQVPNVQRGAPGTFITGPSVNPDLAQMGRLAIMESLGDYVVTIPEGPGSSAGSNFLNQVWNFSDPANPVLESISLGRTKMPYQAHGTIKRYADGDVNIDLGSEEAAIMRANGSIELDSWPGPNDTTLFNISGLYHPWGASSWGFYEFVSSPARLYMNNQFMTEWDHLGNTGVIGAPAFVGNLLIYASDQANRGVAIYDVSDPTQEPLLLDLLTDKVGVINPDNATGATNVGVVETPANAASLTRSRPIGGYGWAIQGHYIVFASRANDVTVLRGGIIVVDFEDPTNLEVSCYIELDNDPMYVNFQDEFAFVDRYKVNIEDCSVAAEFDEGAHGAELSQYSLPLGNIIVGGGIDNPATPSVNEQGISVWVHQSEPDNRAPYVAYHIPKAGQTNYPTIAPISISIPETLRGRTLVPGQNIILREVGGSLLSFDYRLAHFGMITIDPDQNLKADTDYEVSLVGISDYMGNVMDTYTFRFSTGSGAVPSPTPTATPIPTPTPTATPTPTSTATPTPTPVPNSPPRITNFSVSATNVVAGTTVDFTVDVNDPDGDRISYSYNPGFGSETQTASNTYSVTYSQPGTYTARVTATDDISGEAVASRQITITSGAPPPPGRGTTANFANHSRQLYCDIDNSVVWAVNPDNNTVTATSISSGEVVIELTESRDPRSVLVNNNGKIWVASKDTDSIDVYSANGQLIQQISTGYGTAPYGIVSSHDGNAIYASLYNSGEIIRIDANNLRVVDRLRVGATPSALAITHDDSSLLVTRFISTENWGEIWRINTSTMSVSNTIKLYKSNQLDTIANGKGVPNYINSITISPSGEYAYYTGKKDNTDKGLLNNKGSLFLDLDDDNTVRPVIGKIDLANSTEDYDRRFDLDNRESPSALAFSPNADFLFISLQGNNEVVSLNVDDQGVLSTPNGFFETGFAPQGLCMDTQNKHLYVKNFLSRSVSQIDVSDFLADGGRSLNPPIQVFSTVSNEILSPEVLAGKQLFYHGSDKRMSAEGYMSCATCHMDGGHDGRTWDFTGRGEGLRNTTSLIGRSGTRFGTLHWSGNFDEIQDFEHDMRSAFLGLGFLSDNQFAQANDSLGTEKAGMNQDLDNLAAFVSSLGKASLPKSPFRNADGSLTSAGQAGAEIFRLQGCARCHADSAFTDGVAHDVGSLREYSGQRLGGALDKIRTPSLLAVFESAPYLHDGSAATLEDIFSTIGGKVYQAEAHSLVEHSQPVFSNLRKGSGTLLYGGSAMEITINNVDGGSGGQALIRARAGGTNANEAASLVVEVNGQLMSTTLNVPSLDMIGGEQTAIAETKAISINLNAGSNNTVILRLASEAADMIVDDITISNVEHIANASAHTRVLDLPQKDVINLVSFLKQIDQNSAPEDTDQVVLGERSNIIPTPSPKATPTSTPIPTAAPQPTATATPAPIPEPTVQPLPGSESPGSGLLPGTSGGGGSIDWLMLIALGGLVLIRFRRLS